MKPWPQSLLWRTMLLLALLIVTSQLVWFGVVRYLEREPRARQLARQATSVVQLTRTALIAVRPEKRRFFLVELDRQEGIRIYPAVPGEAASIPPNRPFLTLLAREIKQRLGPDTQVAFGRHGLPGLWVSFKIGDDEYWVALPRIKAEPPATLQWILWGALSLVIALVGAWLIAWRINRPVQALAQAAAQIGKGEQPDKLAEMGPLELRILTRSFNQMTADLTRLQQERTVMLAGISHDLRTPLTRLRLAVEMLDKQPDAAAYAGIVQDIADMDAIVGQFLAFARGAQDEPRVRMDLNQLIEATCERYARSGKPIATELTSLPQLTLRPLAMQRLLSNLIDNGFHHGNAEVTLKTAHSGNSVVLSVLDRGPGIPPAQIDAALQPFSRLDAARGGYAGAGLGLAIVEHITQMHEGKLELLQREGGGLEARVTLPV